MDWIFRHIEDIMDNMSEVYTRRSQSPRDEMLRQEENNDPEPWVPFPFYGDLVKPDMMDRDLFDKAQEQRNYDQIPRKDIILDDSAPLGDLMQPDPSSRITTVKSWSKTFFRYKFNDGVTESETRLVYEPDGTEVTTITTRTPQGEETRVVRKKLNRKGEIQERNSDDANPAIAPSQEFLNPSQPTSQPLGIFESVRRWFRREG